MPVASPVGRGGRRFAGSADAIYLSLDLIREERPAYVCVFRADHVYRMDPRQIFDEHIQSGAGVTVAGIRMPISEAGGFGVIELAGGGRRIAAFLEKPSETRGLPDAPDQVHASMGNYVFTTQILIEAVTRDAASASSAHDLGGNIIPLLSRRDDAHVYDFARNEVPGVTERHRGYWRDVGTLDAYHQASMDLVGAEPMFDLYNFEWPILTRSETLPPGKFVFDEPGRRGQAIDLLVCAGVVVSRGEVRRSILSPGVFIHSHAEVEDSVLMHGSRSAAVIFLLGGLWSFIQPIDSFFALAAVLGVILIFYGTFQILRAVSGVGRRRRSGSPLAKLTRRIFIGCAH